MERGKELQLFAVLAALVLFVLVTAEDTKVCCYNGVTAQYELLDTADGKVDGSCNPADGGELKYSFMDMSYCSSSENAQTETSPSPSPSPAATEGPSPSPEAAASPSPSPEPTPSPTPAPTGTPDEAVGQDRWGTSSTFLYGDGTLSGNYKYRYQNGRWQIEISAPPDYALKFRDITEEWLEQNEGNVMGGHFKEITKELAKRNYKDGMQYLWDHMRSTKGWLGVEHSIKILSDDGDVKYGHDSGDDKYEDFRNGMQGSIAENPCAFADVRMHVNGAPTGDDKRLYSVEFCILRGKDGDGKEYEDRNDDKPGYSEEACIDYLKKHGLRDKDGKKIGVDERGEGHQLTLVYADSGQMFSTGALGVDVYGENGQNKVIESLDPAVSSYAPDYKPTYASTLQEEQVTGADQAAEQVEVASDWQQDAIDATSDEVERAAEEAAKEAAEAAEKKAEGLQPLDFAALKCPDSGEYSNAGEFNAEYASMAKELAVFYAQVTGYLEVLRTSVKTQQDNCHEAIDSFTGQYAVSCEIKDLKDKEAKDLELTVVEDAFDPGICSKAVVDHCLKDELWKCSKDLSDETAGKVTTCEMCTVEPCCIGTDCKACAKAENNEYEKLPKCTESSGVICRQQFECCTNTGTDILTEAFLPQEECAFMGGFWGNCPPELEFTNDEEFGRYGSYLCSQHYLSTTAACKCTKSGIKKAECIVMRYNMIWDETDRNDKVIPEEEKSDTTEEESSSEESTETTEEETATEEGDEATEEGTTDEEDAGPTDEEKEQKKTLDTEPFGLASCQPKGSLELGDGAEPYIKTEKGRHTVVDPIKVDACQRQVADLKDLCILDGASILFDDDKKRGPTEVLAKLDTLITTMNGYVAGMKDSAQVAEEMKEQGDETLENIDSDAIDPELVDKFEELLTRDADKVQDTQKDLKNVITFVKGQLMADLSNIHFFKHVPSFAVVASKDWRYEARCNPFQKPHFDEKCEPIGDGEETEEGTEDEQPEDTTDEGGEEGSEEKVDPFNEEVTCEGPGAPSPFWCPLKERGGCNATQITVVVADTNPDSWDDRKLLDLLRNVNPDDLFINEEKCSEYNTEDGGGTAVDEGDVPPVVDTGGTPWYGSITPGQDIPETEKDPLVQCCQRIFGIEDSAWAGGGIVDTARSWLGVPYVFGGTSRSGCDCSGLTMNVLKENGINVPRTASQQYYACESNGGTYVDWGDLQAGDIVFFENTYKPGVSHVGVYAGDDRMIHAPKPGDVVKIVQLSNSYFREHWTGGCRYVEGGASYEALDIDWCEDDTEELCCQGPGLELEKKITEQECGLTCEELCEGKYERHSYKYLVCRHKCGARDEQCSEKPEETACEVDGMDGLCCDEKCMVHALMCAGRVEACVGSLSLDPCTYDDEDGVCCGGRCLTGEKDCSSCKDITVWALNPETGLCDKFTNTCDVPDGWIDCENFGCDTDEDEFLDCSKDGELGMCCGKKCALNAEDCVPDDSCKGMGDGVPCYAKDVPGVCCGEKCAVGGTRCGECVQATTHAKDPETDTCKEFPTPCDVPYGYTACEGYGCTGLIDGAACTKDDERGICCGDGCVVDATGCVQDTTPCEGKAEGGACESDGQNGVCCDGHCALGGSICGVCAQVITFALDKTTEQCEQYPTPCDVPKGAPPCIVESCLSECQNEFPENPSLARNCRELCETMDISCEERCIMDFNGRDERLACIERCPGVITEQMSESLRWCEEDCIDFNNGEPAPTLLCFRLCRAIHPRIHVTFALLRDGQEAESFFTGENPRMRVEVENRGSAGFAGDMNVALRVLDACECEPCPDDYMCSCDCEEEERQVFSLDNIMLAPGEKARYLTDPVRLQSELAGTTVQPVATVSDTYDQVIGKPLGSFYGVSEAEKMAVNDAWFLVNDRERATAAYPGEYAVGFVVFSTDQVPVTLELFMVGWDGAPIEGMDTSQTITWPTRMETFTTGELDVDTAHVDFVIRLGYKVTDASGTVLAEGTLDEQGRPPGLCEGRDLTTWCEGLHERVKLSYPDAYLEVKRPMLDVADAAFIDNDGLAVNRLSGSDSVRAKLELTNLAAQTFEGTVIVKVVGTDGMAVPESVVALDIDRGLEGAGSSIEVESGFVWPKPGSSFRIWITATDRDGRIWLDQIVPTALFPFAELSVTQDATEGLVRNTIFTTIIHEGCLASIRCDDCLTTCELRVDRARCTVTRERCDCECIMEAI